MDGSQNCSLGEQKFDSSAVFANFMISRGPTIMRAGGTNMVYGH